MKRYGWWLVSLLALAFAAAPVLAAEGDDAPKPKRKKGEGTRGRQGTLEQIQAACKDAGCPIAEEKVGDLKTALEAYDAARKEAYKGMGDLRKEMAEARKAKDKAKAQELEAKAKELEKPANDAMAKAMTLLTDDQKCAVEGSRMARMITMRLAKAELTDEQKAKILKDFCIPKAKELKDADEKAKRAAYATLFKDVCDKVLTDEQKAKVPAPKEGKPAGERPKRKKTQEE